MRRLHYLDIASGRTRWWRKNKDMSVRIEAARRTDREEGVELAMIKSLGLPAEPPESWKDLLDPATQPLLMLVTRNALSMRDALAFFLPRCLAPSEKSSGSASG